MNKVGMILTFVITLLCVGMKFNSVAMNNDPALINQLRKINTEIEKKERELEKAGSLEEFALAKELNALREKQTTIQRKLLKGEAKAPIRESIPAIECPALSKGFVKFLYYKTVKATPAFFGWIAKIVWSPDGNKLAIEWSNGFVKILDVTTGQLLNLIQPGGGSHRDSITWSPDSNIVVIASDRRTRDKSIPDPNNPNAVDLVPGDITYPAIATVWDANTGVQLKTLQNVKSAAWSPKGNKLAVIGRDGFEDIVEILDTVSWVKLATIRCRELVRQSQGGRTEQMIPIDQVVWSPNGEKLATISDFYIAIWDTSGKRGAVLKFEKHINSVEWNPYGSKILTASGYAADIWDATTGTRLHHLDHSFLSKPGRSNNFVRPAKYSPNGNKIATAFRGTVTIWDATTGEIISPNFSTNLSFVLIAWSPDSIKLAVTGGIGHEVNIFNATTGAQVGPTLSLGSAGVAYIEWSQKGKFAVVDDSNLVSSANIWDFTTVSNFLEKLSINQCELLQAFDMAMKEKGRIQATPSQWQTFSTFPTAIVDALNLYIRQAPVQPAQMSSNLVLPIKLTGQFDPNGIFSNGNITSDFIEVAQDNTEPITYQTYEEITSNPNGAILALVETLVDNRKTYNVYEGVNLKNWLESQPGTDPSNMQPINKITYYITPSALEPFMIIPIRPANAPTTEQYPSAEIVSAFFKAVAGNPAAQRTVGNYYRDKGATRIANEWFRKAGVRNNQ